MVSMPHGGRLVNRVVDHRRREDLLGEARELLQIRIGHESTVDAKNIAHGVYSPLEGFMNEAEYRSVVDRMRLPNDLPWTMPVLLDVARDEAKILKVGDDVSLNTSGNEPVAMMHIEDIYEYDREEYARKVFKTNDTLHPGVAALFQLREQLIGGRIELIGDTYDVYQRYTLHPAETRILFGTKGWKSIVGFQTRNAPHIGHEFLQKMALHIMDGVFINPVIGKKKRGDFKDEAIVAAYEALIDNYYPKDTVLMGVLHYEMKYAGPREAILHAIMRKNFGCTHFIVGRDHAGVGNFYGPYEAQEIFGEFPDLGVAPLFFREFFRCRKCGGVVNEKTCPHSEGERLRFSGTKLRDIIVKGLKPPPEIMRPEVTEAILRFRSPFME